MPCRLVSADRWDLDQTTGIITWTFPDKTATAQILGSFSPGSGSWLWAWANQSILPDISRDSRSFCHWAEANGHPALAQPECRASSSSANSKKSSTPRAPRRLPCRNRADHERAENRMTGDYEFKQV
jgi:hypothetical protein